jgi:hypothetical protein
MYSSVSQTQTSSSPFLFAILLLFMVIIIGVIIFYLRRTRYHTRGQKVRWNNTAPTQGHTLPKTVSTPDLLKNPPRIPHGEQVISPAVAMQTSTQNLPDPLDDFLRQLDDSLDSRTTLSEASYELVSKEASSLLNPLYDDED